MKRVLMLASFAFFGFNAAYAQEVAPEAQPQQEVNPNAPEITFEATVVDYGTVEQGSDGNRTFTFTNTGKEPLILTNVRSSCGCTIPKWSRNPIAPGETTSIVVHYDTNRLGAIHKTITVTSNAKNGNVVLTIKGKVVPKDQTPTVPVKTESASKVINN